MTMKKVHNYELAYCTVTSQLSRTQTGKRGSCRRDIVRNKEIFRRDARDKTWARDVYA